VPSGGGKDKLATAMNAKLLLLLTFGVGLVPAAFHADQNAPAAGPEGVPLGVSLFNGRDLSGWKVPPGDNGHWKVIDNVIDYDAESEAGGDKHLWTERSYGDFVLRLEWRLKSTPYINPNVPIIRFDGTHKKNAEGRDIRSLSLILTPASISAGPTKRRSTSGAGRSAPAKSMATARIRRCRPRSAPASLRGGTRTATSASGTRSKSRCAAAA